MLDTYRRMRHKASVLPDNGDYDLNRYQANPEIYRAFACFLRARKGFCALWEPFGNPNGISIDILSEFGLHLVVYSLQSNHRDVIVANACEQFPEFMVDGIIFHPPYYGSSLQSDSEHDVSRANSFQDWKSNINDVVENCHSVLRKNGYCCVIGRRYRYQGQLVDIADALIDLFQLEIENVWISTPDVCVILRKD